MAGLSRPHGESDLSFHCFQAFLARAKHFGYALQWTIKGSAISHHFEMLISKLVDHCHQVVTKIRIEDVVNRGGREVSNEDVEILEETQKGSLSKSYVDWLALIVLHFDAVEVLVWFITQAQNYNKPISIKHLVVPDMPFNLLPLEELFNNFQAFPLTTEGDPNSTMNKKLFTFLLNVTRPSTEALCAIKTLQKATEYRPLASLGIYADNLVVVDGYSSIPG